jgi:hypothetical protein
MKLLEYLHHLYHKIIQIGFEFRNVPAVLQENINFIVMLRLNKRTTILTCQWKYIDTIYRNIVT